MHPSFSFLLNMFPFDIKVIVLVTYLCLVSDGLGNQQGYVRRDYIK